jgi:hypothetical protein
MQLGEASPLPGELPQLQRAEGVGDERRWRVGETGLLDHRPHALGEARSVPCVELAAGNALRWVLRVEVEGQPLDPGAEPALQPRRTLEGDVAERSDVVRPDGDRKAGVHDATVPSTSGVQRLQARSGMSLIPRDPRRQHRTMHDVPTITWGDQRRCT